MPLENSGVLRTRIHDQLLQTEMQNILLIPAGGFGVGGTGNIYQELFLSILLYYITSEGTCLNFKALYLRS